MHKPVIKKTIFSSVLTLLCGVGLLTCIDPHHLCGPNQFRDNNYYCVCVDGAVTAPDNNGCKLCREHEIVVEDKCTCEAGYQLDADTQVCVSVSQGAACDPTAATPCNSADFSHCHATSATTGYCTTSGCSAAANNCTNGYYCDESVTPSYCQRPPTGQGVHCELNSECALFEATYCQVNVTPHQCLVQNCTVSPNNCFGTRVCCDFSGSNVSLIPNICILPDAAAQVTALVPGVVCSP